MDGRLKQISQMCLDNQKLLLGTEGGNIYHLNLTTFVIEESIIYQDLVIQHSTDEFKVNPGAVEALHLHPKDDTKILIGKKIAVTKTLQKDPQPFHNAFFEPLKTGPTTVPSRIPL